MEYHSKVKRKVQLGDLLFVEKLCKQERSPSDPQKASINQQSDGQDWLRKAFAIGCHDELLEAAVKKLESCRQMDFDRRLVKQAAESQQSFLSTSGRNTVPLAPAFARFMGLYHDSKGQAEEAALADQLLTYFSFALGGASGSCGEVESASCE